MLSVKASGKTKVRKLDMPTTIQEDIIRLYVTVEVVSRTLLLYRYTVCLGYRYFEVLGEPK